MPPTSGSKPPPSASRELIKKGPREIAASSRTKRNARGERPTTSRALVLRNGKYGARGTGEVMLTAKLSGREKLDLLAEDLIEKSKTALGQPVSLEKCFRIAEAQRNEFLDQIRSFRDVGLFYQSMKEEVNARTPSVDGRPNLSSKNLSYIAEIVVTKIHNSYMIASAWKLVTDMIQDLIDNGVEDSTLAINLKSSPTIRNQYLVLWDLVNVLVEICHSLFAVLISKDQHYSRYFKVQEADGPENDPQIVFDNAGLKEAGRSFIDSIIIELAFPQSPYPRAILYQILRDASDESFRDSKRFSQAVWDAVGVLSDAIALRELLEVPLLGPQGRKVLDTPRHMPDNYGRWMDAGVDSNKASEMTANFEDLISPLEKTKDQAVLSKMWERINLSYESVCQKDIDSLWQLSEALHCKPQWHSVNVDQTRMLDSDSDSDDIPTPFVGRKKQPLRLTNYTEADSDGSMPSLQSVSNSSEEGDDDHESDDNESDDEGSDSGYDTGQEDELRELLREAMDAVHEADLWETKPPPELDPLAQDDRKGNPFLKTLGSLRGRMFSSSSKLKTPGQSTAKPSATAEAPGQSTTKPSATAEAPASLATTVEDIEDEEASGTSATKKKKKKKSSNKKKKNKTTAAATAVPPGSTPDIPPNKAQPTSSSTEKKAAPGVPASASTISLPIGETTAQPARSYLRSEQHGEPKAKVKSRPDHASIFSQGNGEHKSFCGFRRNKDRAKDEEEEQKEQKKSMFAGLKKKSKDFMAQLLKMDKKVKPMKWENFLRVMREMGFRCDPSTAGSSVRFDPPDPRDQSISVHKPHPDTTLRPEKVLEVSKKLMWHYGWNAEDF
ncbi:hypothetical protein FISHEDRAFT_30122, partial [Fistulina hepatica ATCC 64428]